MGLISWLENNMMDCQYKKYFDVVVEGMAQCVIRGTARIVYVPDLNICGKTGTSQNPHGDDHSVFFAFAPKDDPKIAIAVYVENAGWGSSYAAPIAGLMIERFLNDTIADNRKYIEERMVNANLIDKFLKNKPTVKTSVKASAPKKSEPAPEPVEIPCAVVRNSSRRSLKPDSTS